jgi:hypothetical protein
MPEDPAKSYSLDPDESRLTSDTGAASREPIKTGRPLEPLPLDDEEPPSADMGGAHGGSGHGAAAADSRRDSIHALDVCPNCGANMPGSGTLVCLRCGFDLKTLRVIKPQVIEGEKAARLGEAEEPDLARETIAEPGRGDLWLPAIVGAAAVIFMLISYIAGYAGLFHPDDDVTVARRMLGVIKYIAWLALWTGMGLSALAVVAGTNRERVGNWKLAAIRMAGIAAVMSLVLLLSFGTSHRTLEFVVELIGMAAVFMSLVLVLFNMDLPRAGLVTSVFAGMHLLPLLIGQLIVWLYGPV